MNRRGIILSVAALGVAGFGGATWYVKRPAPASKTETVAPELAEALFRPYSPILGPEDAPVTIVEFFDPACEACRRYWTRSRLKLGVLYSKHRTGLRCLHCHFASVVFKLTNQLARHPRTGSIMTKSKPGCGQIPISYNQISTH